jgi:diguanylate cyclase (GGDEF)-like protein
MPLKSLKRYRTQDLEPGMVLGKTILNDKGQVMVDQGKVILQEGTLITPELIDRLMNWNIRVVDVQVMLPPRMKTTDADAFSKEKLYADMLECISTTNSLSVILDRLIQGIGRLYPTEHVFLTLLEGAPTRWWVVASEGSFRLPDVALEQKFQGPAYLEGQSVIIGELSMHKAPPVLSRADMLSMCGIPIRTDGETVGVLEVFSQRPNAFSSEDSALFLQYARMAAVAILSTHRYELLQQASRERSLLYEIMEFISAALLPTQLLSKVADKLNSYFCAQAVAAFSVQRLVQLNKTTEVLSRNFTRTDMDNLTAIFAERWPATFADRGLTNAGDDQSEKTLDELDRQKAFAVMFSGGKSIYILPLYSRDLLQGIIVLLWDYNRRIENYSNMEELIRIVASQTAFGLERYHLYAGVKKIGLTDELTGLSNRRMFNYLMEREINRSRRYVRPLSLVMIDIDHFKKINDTWGHQVGDMVLRELGALMRENFRKLDVPVRYGGEEFAAILPETPLEEAIQFAERFRMIVENSVFMHGKNRITVTISLGIASIGNSPISEELDSDQLLQYADRALYQAKQNGRNRIAAGRN